MVTNRVFAYNPTHLVIDGTINFGAATGGANDNHQLLSWSLTFK